MNKQWQETEYLNLATKKKDGSWVNTPIWFAPSLDDNAFYAFSAGNAGKVKRLRNFSEVKVAPCTVTGKLIGNWEETQAFLALDAEAEKALSALRKHYGWKMRLMDIGSKLSNKFNKRTYLKIIIPTE